MHMFVYAHEMVELHIQTVRTSVYAENKQLSEYDSFIGLFIQMR